MALKACVFNRSGHAIARASAPITTLSPHTGWLELDPHQVWEDVKAVLQRVVAESGVPARSGLPDMVLVWKDFLLNFFLVFCPPHIKLARPSQS
jgi:hypothetical protein